MGKFVLSILILMATAVLLLTTVFSGALIVRFPFDKTLSTNYYRSPLTDTVYFCEKGDWWNLGLQTIAGIKANEFVVLGSRHGKFGNALVYGNKIFPQVDAGRVELLSAQKQIYLKDSKEVYVIQHKPLKLIKIDGAHAPSFELFGDPQFLFARDKKRIYRKTRSIETTGSDIEILDHELYRDGDQLVFLPQDGETPEQKITLAAPNISKLGFGYYDRKTIYFVDYKQKKIVAVEVKDPESVRADGEAIVYDGTKLVPTASAALQEK